MLVVLLLSVLRVSEIPISIIPPIRVTTEIHIRCRVSMVSWYTAGYLTVVHLRFIVIQHLVPHYSIIDDRGSSDYDGESYVE